MVPVVLIVCGVFFIYCAGCSNTASKPSNTNKLVPSNVTLTEYNKERMAKMTIELLHGESTTSNQKSRLRDTGWEDIFNLSSTSFGDVTAIDSVVTQIMGYCSPNYAQENYQLDQQMQSEISSMQTQLTSMQSQLTTLQNTVNSGFTALTAVGLSSAVTTYKTSTDGVENAMTAITNFSSAITNCNSEPSCLTGYMTKSVDIATWVENLSGLTPTLSGYIDPPPALPPKGPLTQSQIDTISLNYNATLTQAMQSTLYTLTDNLYSAVQSQVVTAPGTMGSTFENYNNLIMANYFRQTQALQQLYVNLLNVVAVLGTLPGSDIPQVTGYPNAGIFFNLTNFIYSAMLSLTTLTTNDLISDVPVQDINCSNYTNKTISYPIQSPKYWTNTFPGGPWTNTCDIYIWSGLNNGNYSGTWDNNTLTAQCTRITTLINSDGGMMEDGGATNYNCVMFNYDGGTDAGTDAGTDGGTFMNMSISYSSICNSGSGVGAQYLPTLTGFTTNPVEYGYCSSVNMNYYNNSSNYSWNYPGGAYLPTETTLETWCDKSSCSACQWTFSYDSSYFDIPGTANNFSATCNNSNSQFGIWASHKNTNGNHGNFAQFVIGTNTNGSSSHTNSGAFLLVGQVSTHDSHNYLLPGFGCYQNDNRCNLNVSSSFSNSLCYGTDEIQLNPSPGQGWVADYIVITDGCYYSYADKSGIISQKAH